MTEAREHLPLLDAKGVSKSFGAVVALKNASLTLEKGKIVALMGANGAGKSTFVKALTGALKPDSGHVKIKGVARKVGSPAEALRSGLVPVYQEPSLIPDLSVADNLRLGGTPVSAFFQWVETLGVTGLFPEDTIKHLPLATLRIIDLARALASEPEVLLMDEMTAALPSDLVKRVLETVRKQADNGLSVIYVSHRFSEIAQICDSATVLRDGSTVGNIAIETGVESTIVEMMLGEALDTQIAVQTGRNTHKPAAAPRLKVQGLAAGSKLEDVSFDLHKGEVLGVVALEGQGQDELFEALAGLRKPTKGQIFKDGTPVSFRHPADALHAGLSFVPGDRADGLLMERSIHENIALPQSARFTNWGVINRKTETRKVNDAIKRLQIDTRAKGEVQRLSGGNQQKVTIGRWIASGVETLLLFDPTRGIDVRTKGQMYKLVQELAAQGASVLYYTSELSEITAACDRAIVIFKGRVVGIIEAKDADEQTLMRAAYGLTETQKVPA